MLRWIMIGFVVTCAMAELSAAQTIITPEITAYGRGEAKAAPTSAMVSISVTTRAPTAAQAAADNAARLDATLKALRGVGLAPNELSTIGYSVAQNYETTREVRTPSGFIARNTIRAEVRKLDDLGKVIDAALAGGATEISGVAFLSANSESARLSALAEAVRQARGEAETIARAAGGTLGRLITLASGGTQLARMEAFSDIQLRGMAGGVAGTSITPRDLPIVATVSGRWEFVPGPAR